MISSIISRLVILLFGTLYPAYASYKAVRTKNVKEYVKWMMYWIVFALFTCVETFTDVFFGFWFPFYYEIKIVLVIWLLSPATKGSSFLYRKFVHPMLTKREPEIDEYIARAKEQGYTTILQLGSQGMSFATNVIMQTAIKKMPGAALCEQENRPGRDVMDGAKGESVDDANFADDFMAFSDESSVEELMPPPAKASKKGAASARPRRGRSANNQKGGGGIVNHLRKSYSLCDLSKEIDLRADLNRNSMGLPEESVDGVRELQSELRRVSARQRAAAAGSAVAGSHMDLYFPEVDLNIRSHPHPTSQQSIPLSQIRSTDDISSGFVSSDPVYGAEVGGEGLVRSGSLNTARVRRPREDFSGRGRMPKRGLSTEDSDDFDDEGADLERLPTMTPIPLSPYPLFSPTNPADQIPLFLHLMGLQNPQIAHAVIRSMSIENQFRSQSDSRMGFSSGVIVDEIVPDSFTDVDQHDSSLNSRNTNINVQQRSCTDVGQLDGSSLNSKEMFTEVPGNEKIETSSNKNEVVENLKDFDEDNKQVSSVEPQTIDVETCPNVEYSNKQIENRPSDDISLKEDPNKPSEELAVKGLDESSLEVNNPNSKARKARLKKKKAPRPPSVFISNDEQEELLDSEDFQDAESGMEGQKPDLISDLKIESNKSSVPKENPTSEVQNKPNNFELSDTLPVSTPETIVKIKDKHSKLSKLIPSHSIFNFLRDSSRSGAKSPGGSSENIQNVSRPSPPKDYQDGIVIPLNSDDSSGNDNSEFFDTFQDAVGEDNDSVSKEKCDLQIREMSQSPTARRKIESDL